MGGVITQHLVDARETLVQSGHFCHGDRALCGYGRHRCLQRRGGATPTSHQTRGQTERQTGRPTGRKTCPTDDPQGTSQSEVVGRTEFSLHALPKCQNIAICNQMKHRCVSFNRCISRAIHQILNTGAGLADSTPVMCVHVSIYSTRGFYLGYTSWLPSGAQIPDLFAAPSQVKSKKYLSKIILLSNSSSITINIIL